MLRFNVRDVLLLAQILLGDLHARSELTLCLTITSASLSVSSNSRRAVSSTDFGALSLSAGERARQQPLRWPRASTFLRFLEEVLCHAKQRA